MAFVCPGLVRGKKGKILAHRKVSDGGVRRLGQRRAPDNDGSKGNVTEQAALVTTLAPPTPLWCALDIEIGLEP
jgi:hypothetical protein